MTDCRLDLRRKLPYLVVQEGRSWIASKPIFLSPAAVSPD